MGSSLPKFGRIDLELDGPDVAPVPATAPPPRPASRRAPSFGEIDLDAIIGALGAADHEPPRAFVPAPPKETPTRQSLEAVKLAEEETRIAHADVVARGISESRRPPAFDADGVTRTFDDLPPSSTGGSAPSASCVAARGDRVAAMRELYAQGNADAALALASEVAAELESDDPYGGLIPVDEDPFGGLEIVDDSEEHTAIIEASADSSRLAVMTSRQVPRLLVGPKDISKLPMDPRTAFILGHIDGIQSMEEILDVCAMPEAEAIELIERLHRMGVISLD